MDVKNVSAANTQFGLDLLKEIRKGQEMENVFLSPLSISVALAMTQLGAKENTAKEMATTLQWNVADQSLIHKQFQQYVELLQTPLEQFQLSTANRIYIEKTLDILESFITKTKEHYKAEPVGVDFQNQFNEERVKINEWVKEQTQGKITDLLAEGTLNSLTRLVLVNAIYFKGFWKHQFLPANTKPKKFKISPTVEKEVLMMYMSERFKYHHFEDLKCSVVELPYEGEQLSMMVILPDEDFGLQGLVSQLTSDRLSTLLNSERWGSPKVNLTFPKFKVTSTFQLGGMLASLGMVDAFNPQKADLTGIAINGNLYVSSVVHKAFVEVDEKGTEAAAATAVMIVRCSSRISPPPPVVFNVDHPFLFAITDTRAANTILFLGCMLEPLQ